MFLLCTRYVPATLKHMLLFCVQPQVILRIAGYLCHAPMGLLAAPFSGQPPSEASAPPLYQSPVKGDDGYKGRGFISPMTNDTFKPGLTRQQSGSLKASNPDFEGFKVRA